MYQRFCGLRSAAPQAKLPIPPGELVCLVPGAEDIEGFLRLGEAGADSIRSALKGISRPWEGFSSVLDWGCGCGRVLRHFYDAKGPRLYGCDYNRDLINWSITAYPKVKFFVNNLAPPLPFPESSFDLVYGLSVFTHLPEQLHTAWMKELYRVLRPDGFALVTTHGPHYLSILSADEQDRFRSGKLVIRGEECAGTNTCAVFHPESFIRTELADPCGFDVVFYEAKGAKGNPEQDLYILKRRPRATTSA